MRLAWVSSFFLFAALFPLYAQQPENPLHEADTLERTVITASQAGNRLSKIKDLRTELISSSGLMKMACCNLAESFENSASVTVGYSDAITGARQIRLLGLSGIYTQMLDEARPVMRGLSAPFGLSYIPGPWLESIQIAKGSPSVINGVESMTGQINVEHRKPTDEIPLFLNASVMSDTKADFNLASSLQLSPALSSVVLAHADANFRAHDMNMDGFRDEPLVRQFGLANRWLLYYPGVQVRWGISAVADNREGGQVSGGWTSNIDNKQLNAYLKVGIPLREDGSESVAAVFDYAFDKMDATFGGHFYKGAQNSAFVNLIYRNRINESNDITAGFSVNADSFRENMIRSFFLGIRETRNTIPKQRRSFGHGGFYGEYTFHSGDIFSAIAGLRGELYDGDIFRLSPRVTVKYAPFNSLVFRANAGRGIRQAIPLTDHFGVFSTGKLFMGDYMSHPVEDSWTYGGNATWYFRESNYLSLDFFGTSFSSQLVVDYEAAPGTIAFYPLDGKSFSNNFQADLHLEPFTRFTADITARYTDARITLNGKGLVEVPLVSRFKGVLNLQYKTRLSRWIFDFTASLNGSARVYDFMDGYETGRTPAYPLLYAQVTRRFKGFDIYIGGENLSGFRQKNVILGDVMPDGMVNPWTMNFDASAVWGPLMGAKIYAGIRVTLWKKN